MKQKVMKKMKKTMRRMMTIYKSSVITSKQILHFYNSSKKSKSKQKKQDT